MIMIDTLELVSEELLIVVVVELMAKKERDNEPLGYLEIYVSCPKHRDVDGQFHL
jgi:hypothetical protein